MDKSFLKGLAALDFLAQSDGPVGVTQLARAMGITPSNAHRLLQALVASEFARPVGQRGGYEATLKLWRLGARTLARLDVKAIAAPHLARLMAEAQETANLSVLDGHHMVYVDRVETDVYFRAYNQIGGQYPLHCTGTGKVLLAYADDAVRNAVCADLRPFTARTITDPAKLLVELERVRTGRIATTLSEFREGIASVAAPVFGAHGRVVAALGVSGPLSRLKPSRMRQLRDMVGATASRVSRLLGGPGTEP